MKNTQRIITGERGFHERLQQELLTYPEKTIHEDGSVVIQQIQDPYFLINDMWDVERVGQIKQFSDSLQKYISLKSKFNNISFSFKSPSVNLEVKYIFYQRIFRDEWNIYTAFKGVEQYLRLLITFMNRKYPTLSSLLHLDIESAEREWIFWLNERGRSTTCKTKRYGKIVSNAKTKAAAFLRLLYSKLFILADFREEWQKDRWDIRILHEQYGLKYNKSSASHYIDFTKIEHKNIREQAKRYIKLRLLNGNNFRFSTAINYMIYISNFFLYIFSVESTWIDIKKLKRSHIEGYIQWLRKCSEKNLKNKNAHPEHYIYKSLTITSKFLNDIQLYKYDIAPQTDVRMLIFREDFPKLQKKPIDQIDYIPDFVLEQLFTNINSLNEEIIPVIWIAFKTGLRISDVLCLKDDCLRVLNGQYSIMTNIEKTNVKGHRIPIDHELADMIAVLTEKSLENSNQDNNPEGFIFIRYRGSRKGRPFGQSYIRGRLNQLAIETNIVDENGELFHFKTHQFRHTYAVKMLNGGADILTVQELLAHASPEMTLRYAKLLDDTKRKAFESVINQGVFSFNLNGEIQEITATENIPSDILDALWQDHKLNAMDNPYGTCHARLNGNCPHMEEPPCLTCNGGSPCRDLAIGFSELDVQKYELLIKTTSKTMELAKQKGRSEIIEKYEKNLTRYEDILRTIQKGDIIFGRQERMKRKLGI
ncbi:TPA: tyrosine-type recombinase/integrase [Bacillus cereus]|uniref:tyrosine-type recombinase/integrase n=1 Tax=Bacillus paranthracis TaxID=2026186 RepID=UPI001E2A0878|nr:tyrosine-type recombinase/integrase [Bacillus paranthracis]MCC2375217.1 tyrosine-type recombinase/integrase [Bacillus paranthracis]HDR6247077.1 tyrosine-type recombinase/integrase [Bacillus cereus]